MLLCIVLGRVMLQRVPHRAAYFLLFAPFLLLLIASLMILLLWSEILQLDSSASALDTTNIGKVFQFTAPSSSSSSSLDYQYNRTQLCPAASPPALQVRHESTPYHNWELFSSDYEEMLKTFKVFVYPDVDMRNESSPFARIFLPHPNPMDLKIGNYFSEHAFKLALLQSPIVTRNPKEAHFFYMPFSINVMRNHPLVRSEASISRFVASYVSRISSQFQFWNASGGADHFYVCCHSVGRDAASRHFALRNNAIQITCSSNYFQRLYTAHKDIALPQIRPHPYDKILNPPEVRDKLVFFAGRVQNSGIRQELLKQWQNDTSFSIFSGHPPFPYQEGFRRSRYCLHVKGYEVNTARVVSAIRYGCVPVLVSNYYDLPFANVLDWSKFSISVNQRDVSLLKHVLASVSEQLYLDMYRNLCTVRKHFIWNMVPADYDAFYMTAYQLWLRRGLHHIAT